MADTSTRITNLSDLSSGSPNRVAFDLMLKISNAEFPYGTDKPKPESPRAYYLELFEECRRVSY